MNSTKSLPSGTTYAYASGQRICTGSSMGRRDSLPDEPSKSIKMSLRRLRWVDGDYDEQGAYWGHVPGTWIYWASAWGMDDEGECFVRASSREDAKSKVRQRIPGARFFN